MSHQSGLRANDKLIKVFRKCKDGKLRVIKVSIDNEELTLSGTKEIKKDWEKDYDKSIIPLIEESVPCYILYRLDHKTSLGFAWLLICWVPDTANIRQKMVYASTKATLKTEFGSAQIAEELHATTLEELTLNGYFQSRNALTAPPPLTTREEELKELQKTEINTDINTDTKQVTLNGITCPMSNATIQAIKDMVNGSYNYLRFIIDLQAEEIHLEKAANFSLEQIPEQISDDHARYHIYLFDHVFQENFFQSYVFIYSMPGYSCSVKERMMYSSCKASFLQSLEEFGLNIAKKLEIDSGSELTMDFLQDELHPKKAISKPAFAKPKGPPNRGAKRVTRPETNYTVD